MIIRPEIDSEFRELMFDARERCTVYALLDREDLLSVLLWCVAGPYRSQDISSFVSEADVDYSEFLPAGLGEALFDEYDFYETIVKGVAYPQPVEYEGRIITSRERARIALREYVPNYDALMAALYTAWVDVEDPTKIHYSENTKVGWRARAVSVAKFLKMLNHKHGFRFPKEEIDRIATRFGTEYRKPEYEFELSDNVCDTYDEEGFGSCMHGSDSVYFYDCQDNVQVLRILKKDGRLAGRALVWSNVRRYDSNGRLLDHALTVMDRIYPSDGGYHIKAAIEYANEHGWVNKEEQSVGGEFSLPGMYEVDVDDTGDYPYMDSFSYSTEWFNRLMCWRRAEYLRDEEDEEIYAWHSTEGYAPELA